MDDERVWILDTEANGHHPGEIVELAAVEMVGLVLTGRYRQWRFRPREPIHPRATRVHGIRDRDLRHAPRIDDHADELRDILADHPIAGHAVHVELAALQRALPGWRPRKAYDTLRIVRRAYPDLLRHRLSSIGDHLGLSDIAARLTGKAAHSAVYDALLCGLVMRHVVHPLEGKDRADMLAHAEIIEMRRQRELQAARKAARKQMRREARSTDTST